MGTYTAKTRNIGKRPRSKRLRELGGTVINNSGAMPDLSGCELVSNKVTAVDSESTDVQYPTAKLLYDLYAALGALIDALDEGKQDAIADLAAIRSGAALGATALQAITAAAGSDIGTVGTPSVTVSTQGSSTTLTFHQLKGAKGDKGDKGDTGATGPTGPQGPQGPAGSNATVTIDSALSDSSTNPVQNKVVNSALAKIAVYNNNLNGNNIDYNLVSYERDTFFTIQPIHAPNYSNQNNKPFNNYGQMVTLGGRYSYFPFRIAFSHNDAELYLQYGGYKTASTFNFSNCQWRRVLNNVNFASYALPLTGGTISDTAITTAKTVLDVVAGVSSPSTSNNVYGIKATLTQTGSNVNTNSAAIYGVASAGYAGLFSGMVKVSSTLTANSVSAATVYQTSDDRLKDYVGDFHFALADIDKIPLRFFTFKDDPDKRVLIGTSAQAVQKVLPEIVGSSRTASEEDSEEYLNVDYSKLALVALDCVRQLRDEVAALRAEIEELKRGR